MQEEMEKVRVEKFGQVQRSSKAFGSDVTDILTSWQTAPEIAKRKIEKRLLVDSAREDVIKEAFAISPTCMQMAIKLTLSTFNRIQVLLGEEVASDTALVTSRLRGLIAQYPIWSCLMTFTKALLTTDGGRTYLRETVLSGIMKGSEVITTIDAILEQYMAFPLISRSGKPIDVERLPGLNEFVSIFVDPTFAASAFSTEHVLIAESRIRNFWDSYAMNWKGGSSMRSTKLTKAGL